MIDLRALDVYRNAEWEERISRGAPFPKRDCGGFYIRSPQDGAMLHCIAARGSESSPWDHVSISREDRVPSYEEMDYLYGVFFRPGEFAVQFHVPSEEHVNHHPHCLHLWRYTGLKAFPRPPSIAVGLAVTGRQK